MSPLAFATLALMAVPIPPPDPAALRTDWSRWHAERLLRLGAPDGWLALAGLHWLAPGENRVDGLPGAFRVAEGKVTLEASEADGWRLDGKPVTRIVLGSDANGGTADKVANGTRTAAVIDRGGKLALRVWDAERPTRRSFRGIDTFPFDPRWRIEARWEAYPAPRAVEVPSIVGIPTHELAPGRARFTVGGVEYALEPTQDGDTLFFVFKDATAPRETYGAGRFLYADAPRDGKVILDFNRAYNPPCAFTDFATCPLPRPDNVLKLRIDAGEKKISHP